MTSQCHPDSDIPAHKAELVPTAYHTALVVQAMCFFLLETVLEGSVLGGDSGGTIPLEATRCPVAEVDGLPIWVVAGAEGSTVNIEFVKEDQL